MYTQETNVTSISSEKGSIDLRVETVINLVQFKFLLGILLLASRSHISLDTYFVFCGEEARKNLV